MPANTRVYLRVLHQYISLFQLDLSISQARAANPWGIGTRAGTYRRPPPTPLHELPSREALGHGLCNAANVRILLVLLVSESNYVVGMK